MPTGHTSALAKAGTTPYAVLEVDEHYLAQVLDATNPRVVALLNLSRDQLDRAKEVAMMAAAVARRAAPARRRARRGQRRRPDGGLGRAARPSPGTGHLGRRRPALARRLLGLPGVRRLHRAQRRAVVRAPRCDAAPARCRSGRSTDDGVVDPHRRLAPGRRCSCPAGSTAANAATALAVAAAVRGAARSRPCRGWPRSPRSPAGTPPVERDGRTIRLLLAKNPAGWLEAFDMAEDAPTLLSINARDPDGLDTSWLYDVDFSPLRGRRVLITGDRAMDLAVRLEVNEVPFEHVHIVRRRRSRAVPPGRLEVIANYTAFQDIRAELDRVN